MNFADIFKDKIFNTDCKHFDDLALELFHYQVKSIPIYKDYLDQIKCNINDVTSLKEIKYLPISFFKSNKICREAKADFFFQSSGTTDVQRSKHFVNDLNFYKYNATTIFERQYGSLKNFVIIALLPSYQENLHSSLIFMVNDFITKTHDEDSKYVLGHQAKEIEQIIYNANLKNKKVLLIGVTFALLDFAIQVQWGSFSNLLVMETGGMKGRREELTRQEVHQILSAHLGVDTIHSEYGMTELLSQAYSSTEGKFHCPCNMKVTIRETNDPFCYQIEGKAGGINIIDLANVDSCAFIETQDIGKINSDGTFSVLGRLDNSDIRGCNMLLE